MAGRALPISPCSPPKRIRPPDTPVCRKVICFNSKLNFRFKVRFGVDVFVKRSDYVWRIRSDVKSESYEVSKGSFKVKGKLGIDVAREEIGDEFVAPAPWWEDFPKRWTIVILCFSAFLLCFPSI